MVSIIYLFSQSLNLTKAAFKFHADLLSIGRKHNHKKYQNYENDETSIDIFKTAERRKLIKRISLHVGMFRITSAYFPSLRIILLLFSLIPITLEYVESFQNISIPFGRFRFSSEYFGWI